MFSFFTRFSKIVSLVIFVFVYAFSFSTFLLPASTWTASAQDAPSLNLEGQTVNGAGDVAGDPAPGGKETCVSKLGLSPSSWIGAFFSCGVDLVSSVGTFIFKIFIVVINFLGYWVMMAINGILLQLLALFGRLMDWMIYYTVVDYKNVFGSFPSPDGREGGLIYYAWTIIRDILNTGVFFIVVFNGVIVMFNGFADVKKKFISLLVFVVLVNFSLLFVKLCIDISNIAVLTGYNTAAKPSGTETWDQFKTSLNPTTEPGTLSEFVLTAINPVADRTEVRSGENVTTFLNAGSFIYQLLRMFMYLALAFFFIYFTGVFLARAISFLLIMILSPLLVAGSFFESKKLKQASEWLQGELFEETTQAPVLVFFMILSALMARSLFTGVGDAISLNGSASNFTTNDVISLNIVMFVKTLLFVGFNYVGFQYIRELTSRGGYLSEKIAGGFVALGVGASLWGTKKALGAGLSAFQNTNAGSNMQRRAKIYAAGKSRGTIGKMGGWASSKFIGASDTIENGSLNPFTTNIGKKFMGAMNTAVGLKTGNMNLASSMFIDNTSIKGSKQKKADKLLAQSDKERDLIAGYIKDDHAVTNADLLGSKVLKTKMGDKDLTYKELAEALSSANNSELQAKMAAVESKKDADGKFDENEKIEHNGLTLSYKDWAKMPEEKDKLEKKLADGAERAKLVKSFREGLTKDTKKEIDKGIKEYGTRKTVRGMVRRGFANVHDVLSREDRTHADDIAWAKAKDRIKDSEKSDNTDLQTARTIYSTGQEASRYNIYLDKEIAESKAKLAKLTSEIKNTEDKYKTLNETTAANFERSSEMFGKTLETTSLRTLELFDNLSQRIPQEDLEARLGSELTKEFSQLRQNIAQGYHKSSDVSAGMQIQMANLVDSINSKMSRDPEIKQSVQNTLQTEGLETLAKNITAAQEVRKMQESLAKSAKDAIDAKNKQIEDLKKMTDNLAAASKLQETEVQKLLELQKSITRLIEKTASDEFKKKYIEEKDENKVSNDDLDAMISELRNNSDLLESEITRYTQAGDKDGEKRSQAMNKKINETIEKIIANKKAREDAGKKDDKKDEKKDDKKK